METSLKEKIIELRKEGKSCRDRIVGYYIALVR